MRTSTIQKAASMIEKEPSDAVAMMIEGELWAYLDAADLFWRMRLGDIPRDFISETDPDALAFLRSARAHKGQTALPVERGDVTTVGGVPVPNEDLFGAIEKSAGPLTWCVWTGWFVARDGEGKLAAVWKMPDGYGLLEFAVVEVAGDLWGMGRHFAMRLRPPDEDAAREMRSSVVKDPRYAAEIEKRIAASSGAPVVCAKRDGDAVRLGPNTIPAEQIDAIVVNNGSELEWRWAGGESAVVAYASGRAVGLIMPTKLRITDAVAH